MCRWISYIFPCHAALQQLLCWANVVLTSEMTVKTRNAIMIGSEEVKKKLYFPEFKKERSWSKRRGQTCESAFMSCSALNCEGLAVLALVLFVGEVWKEKYAEMGTQHTTSLSCGLQTILFPFHHGTLLVFTIHDQKWRAFEKRKKKKRPQIGLTFVFHPGAMLAALTGFICYITLSFQEYRNCYFCKDFCSLCTFVFKSTI